MVTKKWRVWASVDEYELEGQKWLLGLMGLKNRIKPDKEGYQSPNVQCFQIEVFA